MPICSYCEDEREIEDMFEDMCVDCLYYFYTHPSIGLPITFASGNVVIVEEIK